MFDIIDVNSGGSSCNPGLASTKYYTMQCVLVVGALGYRRSLPHKRICKGFRLGVVRLIAVAAAWESARIELGIARLSQKL